MGPMRGRMLAEGVGTFALVALGTGAIVVDAQTGGAVTHLGVALAFGLVVMAVIYMVGDVSGAHLNPAVSLGFFLVGAIGPRDLGIFVGVQCLAAIAASLCLRWLFPEHPDLGATRATVGSGSTAAVEVAITFLLMSVILGVVAREAAAASGLAIGGTVALCALVAGPLTGASMNPARSLGPALVSGELRDLWVYLAAPTAGAALAVPACRVMRGPGCCPACTPARA